MTTSSTSLFDRIILAIPFLAKLQDWVISLGQRKSATSWLYSLSFLESIIFPLPIDPLLAGIVMARPHHYIRLAILTGLSSTLGGVMGWAIGIWLGDAVMASGWIGKRQCLSSCRSRLFRTWVVTRLNWSVYASTYKVMAVSAGFLGIGFIPLARFTCWQNSTIHTDCSHCPLSA